MDDQTAVGREFAENPSQAMARNVGGFTHDLTTLAELQAKLLAADLREMRTRLTLPISLSVLASLLFVAFLVTLMAGLAFLLCEQFTLSRSAGFALSALCGLVLASVLLMIAWFRLRGSFHVIKRSQEELAKNLQWLRAVLQQRGGAATAAASNPATANRR